MLGRLNVTLYEIQFVLVGLLIESFLEPLGGGVGALPLAIVCVLLHLTHHPAEDLLACPAQLRFAGVDQPDGGIFAEQGLKYVLLVLQVCASGWATSFCLLYKSSSLPKTNQFFVVGIKLLLFITST